MVAYTLIRINRLEPIQKGQIIVDGVPVHDKATNLTRLRADIGFVFQQWNYGAELIRRPHKNVLAFFIFCSIVIVVHMSLQYQEFIMARSATIQTRIDPTVKQNKDLSKLRTAIGKLFAGKLKTTRCFFKY